MISKSPDVRRNKVDEIAVGSEDCSRDWHDSISHCACMKDEPAIILGLSVTAVHAWQSNCTYGEYIKRPVRSTLATHTELFLFSLPARERERTKRKGSRPRASLA
jgi:hypothetical protein